VIAPIVPGQEPKLRQLLDDIQTAIRSGSPGSARIPLGRMSSVHFARWAILEEVSDPRQGAVVHPASLLFSTEYDGTLEEHLQELISDESTPALREIYSLCEGFDAEGGPDKVRLRRYLAAHTTAPSVYFVGAMGRSVGRIRREAEIARIVRDRAHSGGFTDDDPIVAWRCLEEFARARGFLEGHHDVETISLTQMRARRAWFVMKCALVIVPVIALASISLVSLAVSVFLLLAATGSLVLLGFMLRLREDQDADKLEAEEAATSAAYQSLRDAQHEAELERFEDLPQQNQITTITLLKPGSLRQLLQRLVLVVVRIRAKYKFTEGLLSGVPTIHFAHWHLCDQRKRLLFISNYDGSWPGYLDDFIAHASLALTAIWSHSAGFPRSRFLVFDGATQGPRFKAFARRHQVAPIVWYCAYPELSITEINRNTRLVAGLCDKRLGQARYRARAREWLREV
jgi:hypothetical protein